MSNHSKPYPHRQSDAAHPSVKIFHELMAKKVREVLLVSNPYDAFIMEEDGRLAGRIIREYHGLNLSRPPRLTWVSTGLDALAALSKTGFDIVIIMPRLNDMDCAQLGEAIRARFANLPIFLLTHTASPALTDRLPEEASSPFDKMYVWQGSTDLLLALIKSVEDRMNVAVDTRLGSIPVMILVEDDPLFISAILPLLYREIVLQTQRVMEESVNEEHRLLRMRGRPKLLTAETWEEARRLYRVFEPYLLCIISDGRFPKNGKMDDRAGMSLLQMVRREHPDMALLNLSSDETHREAALSIPADFINKHTATLLREIRTFFTERLGFGDFVFRTGDKEIGRARNLRSMEKILPKIPEDVLIHHAAGNHFSTWFRARGEIELAHHVRSLGVSDFSNARSMRAHMIHSLSENRRKQRRAVVVDFSAENFDPDSDFVKIGDGSLGGKARGLAFMSTLIQDSNDLAQKFPHIDICIPKSLVITTEGFDTFLENTELQKFVAMEADDAVVMEAFLAAPFPKKLRRNLEFYLSEVKGPLAVRSSSLLEDSHSQPFAGIYHTCMVPNVHADPAVRLDALVAAIKRVFASVFMKAARMFSENTLHRSESDKMAVIIQQVVGSRHGNVFYPAISGVAHSYNFYPTGPMKREEGVACIALGLGKTVVDGSGGLRFSPKHPELLPGFSTVDDILKNAQRRFYALRLAGSESGTEAVDTDALVQLSVEEARNDFPVSFLASSYIPEDHRIRATGGGIGHPVLTFHNILKLKEFPLDRILEHLLEIGRKGMGGAVEMEFALDFSADRDKPPVFAILQLRPAAQMLGQKEIAIGQQELQRAVCFSSRALGNGIIEDIEDILYVAPDTFDPSKTVKIAEQIGKLGRSIAGTGRKYILIGPGRWGSADPWLGIPVRWEDISGAGIIIETASKKIKATPSQGSHFFHNITARGIGYVTVAADGEDRIDWKWLRSRPPVSETAFVRHVRAAPAPVVKIDGKTSCAVIYEK